MAILIQESKTAREVRYYAIDEARVKWKLLKDSATKMFYLAFLMFWVSPILCLVFLFLFLVKIAQIWNLFFKNTYYMRQYMALFQPQTAEKVVSIIGYRVYENEVDGHLAIIKSQNLQSLIDMQNKMERIVSNKPRWVGIDEKMAKTHIALIGKTGAGKTEFVRSTMHNIMQFGGGILFNDGKSDAAMLTQVLAQAKENNRETSVRVLNFLKAEKLAESNTFNFIANMHPMRLGGFLADLAFTNDSGDGNAAHFKGRGKVLARVVIYALWLRKQLANEPFDAMKIQASIQFLPLCIQYIIFYGVCRDLNEIISQNDAISHLLNSDKSLIIQPSDYFDNLEKLVTKIINTPDDKKKIDAALGFDSKIIMDCYDQTFKLIKNYIASVWNVGETMLSCVSLELYYRLKKGSQKNFFDKNLNQKNIFSTIDIQAAYNELREDFLTNQYGQINNPDSMIYNEEIYNEEISKEYRPRYKLISTQQKIQEAFAPFNSLEKQPNDAIQQHAYAQQQWDNLFTTLAPYSHIFSQAQSEIELVSLFRDNQILYVLLPVLELSKEQITFLGKIIIASIKSYAAAALGGEVLTAHETINKIYKDKITPKPFTLIVLDEYGSYPVDDLDTILAQVRSINMSVMLGIQDVVSLKASGQNETSKERALANTTKIFFKIQDKTAINWIEEMVNEETVEDATYKRDATGNLVLNTEVNIKKEKLVQAKKVLDADNGFCLMFLGGGADRAIWLQSFYRGGKQLPTMLKHFEPINGLKNEHYLKYSSI